MYNTVDVGAESLSEIGAKVMENWGDIVACKNISIFHVKLYYFHQTHNVFIQAFIWAILSMFFCLGFV